MSYWEVHVYRPNEEDWFIVGPNKRYTRDAALSAVARHHRNTLGQGYRYRIRRRDA